MPEGKLSEAEVVRRLTEEFPDAFEDLRKIRDRTLRAAIDRESILPICQFLKSELDFEHCSCISAVDLPDRFESVYHISSYRNGLIIQINARIPRDDPRIESVSGLWYGANWHEREAWDLMGIVYEGHPNLERILLPKDFEHHPLRKDYEGRIPAGGAPSRQG
jgi:NADH-quinone oxidoreductase subunit C